MNLLQKDEKYIHTVWRFAVELYQTHVSEVQFYFLLEKEGAAMDFWLGYFMTLRAFGSEKYICYLWGFLNPIRISYCPIVRE